MANESDAMNGLGPHENENSGNKNSGEKAHHDDVYALHRFLYTHPPLQLEGATLNDVVFNYNLQEFSTRIGFICGLEQGGKLTPEKALFEIMNLWKGLKKMRREFYPRKERHPQDRIDTSEIKPENATVPANEKADSDLPQAVSSEAMTPDEAEIARSFYAFSNKVSIVCSLIAGGKIAPLKGYKIIKKHWRKLRRKFGF